MEYNNQSLIDDDMENERVEQLLNVQTEAKELFKKKNADYGDAFAEYGTIGILVRLGDKIKRLQSISSRGITLVNDEKLRDTLIDLHNYSAMGIMLLDEKDELVIEENDEPIKIGLAEPSISIERWEISGDTGNIYKRQRYTDKKTGGITNCCSCPSYMYSDEDKPTCKHIKEMDKYRVVT